MNGVGRKAERGLCDFDLRRISECCRNMLLNNNLRKLAKNSRDLLSGLN